ncbi:MAG: hypothetical protein ACREVZ_02920, partial [Burkholderiales bacterium]
GQSALSPNRCEPQILGTDEFVTRIRSSENRSCLRHRLEELVRQCSERFEITPEKLASPSRAPTLAAARAWIGHEALAGRIASISEVARRLGRSESTIRYLMSRHTLVTGKK